jgi:hypothetical protein
MPGKHAKDKVFIGGWIPVGLAAGIERWLEKNATKDRTNFIYEAALDKLRASGIEVQFPAEYGKGRPRKSLPKEAYDLVSETALPKKPRKTSAASRGEQPPQPQPEQVISDAQRVSDRKLRNAAVPITPANPLPYSQ